MKTPLADIPALDPQLVDPVETLAFSPALFHQACELISGKLEAYLADESTRGVDLKHPSELLETAAALMTEQHDEVNALDTKQLGKIVDLYIRSGIQVHSPGFMGRQFSGVVPLAAAIDMVGAIVNQPSSFYEAGQLPNVAEKLMAQALNERIGFDEERFTMVTTSGASLGNMTAMLAARNRAFPDMWSHGGVSVTGRVPAIAVSDDAHYSILRAVGVLGLGVDQVVRLPIDEQRRIRADAIRPALEQARTEGKEVFCIVASAGTTAYGAFDPLDAIADITEAMGIWFHVDGAHGASLLLSDVHRHKLRGINRADSFAWDAHKMMFVPAACTLLFYRDKAKSRGAFSQTASYVFDKEPDIYSEYDSGDANFECTKRPMIMGLWTLWSLYGRELFASKIDYLCGLTTHFHHLVAAEGDFVTLHEPEANIICFRYQPTGFPAAKLDALQTGIRDRIREGGTFFISKVDIEGIAALRVVFMNHRIRTEHCTALLESIREIGQSLQQELSL